MTTVVYIAGSGRSGSTLLGSLLGQIPGWFNAGELRYLWERGLVEGRHCGCGEPVRECPVWQQVLDRAGLAPINDAARDIAADQQTLVRLRRVSSIATGRTHPELERLAHRHQTRLATLYRCVGEVSGARVVIDTSKLPTYAHLLASTPGVDLRVVHLVRDARAAAHSWSRRKPLADGAPRTVMQTLPAWRSAALWSIWNATADMLWPPAPARSVLLRYEDFIADPARALSAVLELAGDPGQPPDTTGGRICLSPTHTVAGNPNRMGSGEMRLRLDEEWRTAMPRRDRAVVTTLTAPLLRRYGYAPFQPQPRSHEGARQWAS